MLKILSAFFIPIILLILTFTLLIAGTRALAQTQPRGSWLTWVDDDEIYLWDGAVTHQLTYRENGLASSPIWSHDGWLAWRNIHNPDEDLMVWDGQTVRNVSQSDMFENNPRWSPTGQLAWTAFDINDSQLTVWDRSSGIVFSQPFASHGGIENETTPLWSADGRLVWAIRTDTAALRDLMMWDGETITRVSAVPDEDTCLPAWSADGRLAWMTYCEAAGLGTRQLLVRDGDTITVLDHDHWMGFRPIWSPIGRLTWMSGEPHPETFMFDVYVWDGETSVVATGDLGASNVDWSPNGNRLAFISVAPDGNRDIFLWDGNTIARITRDIAFERRVVWLDNSRLLYQVRTDSGSIPSADLFLWDGETIAPINAIRDTSNPDFEFFVSADGRVAWKDGAFYSLSVWDGQSVTQIANSRGVSDLSWSPIIP